MGAGRSSAWKCPKGIPACRAYEGEPHRAATRKRAPMQAQASEIFSTVRVAQGRIVAQHRASHISDEPHTFEGALQTILLRNT